MHIQRQKVNNKILSLILGPALFVACLLFIPGSVFPASQRTAIGTVVWMGWWWITMPVEVGITALLPLIVNALFGIIPMSNVTVQYASEIVILLFGADLISITWEETGLDKRIALKAICVIGPSIKQQIAVWFIVSAILSSFLPNSVVCAVLTPLAVAMLRFIGETEISKSKAGAIILSSIAWGAGIGGLGSPLGGAMNLVAVESIQNITGKEFLYVDWIVRLFPMLIVLVTVNLIYLMAIRPKSERLEGSREYFKNMYVKMNKISQDEIISLSLFVIAVLLSFGRPLFQDILPSLKPAYAFLVMGVVSFFIRKKDGSEMLTWKNAANKMMWGLLFLYAGGLAVGSLISNSGTAATIGTLIAGIDMSNQFVIIFVIVPFTVLLAEISSNTAAAAISLPVVISITQGLGLNPIPYIFVTSAAFNCAYVLPTSIRAIPIGYGLSPKYLFKNGLVLTLAGIVLISAMGYFLVAYAPGFSGS